MIISIKVGNDVIGKANTPQYCIYANIKTSEAHQSPMPLYNIEQFGCYRSEKVCDANIKYVWSDISDLLSKYYNINPISTTSISDDIWENDILKVSCQLIAEI